MERRRRTWLLAHFDFSELPGGEELKRRIRDLPAIRARLARPRPAV
jgi:hypothetical protein